MRESLLLSFFLKREGNKEGIYRCGACRNNHAGNRGGAGRRMRSGNHGLLRRLPQRFRLVTYYPSVSGGGGGINASSAGNMKPLICLCVGLTALLIAAGAASSVAVQAISRLRSPVDSIVRDTAPAARKGYTILINTWKRNDLLHESVLHYSKCDGVDSIHVIWSEPEPPSDSLYDALSEAVDSNSKIGSNVDLIFDLNDEDSLNNRFQEIKDLNFDAIFSIDDDVIFPCKSVEFAFTVWKSAPETMVGFVPRMLWLDTIVIQSTIFMVGGGQSGGPALTTWFFPRNCEDIAMALLIANETGSPPIWVKGRIFEMGSTGISSLGSHEERRTQCVNDFTDVYGHMPLVLTNVKTIDSRSSWLW